MQKIQLFFIFGLLSLSISGFAQNADSAKSRQLDEIKKFREEQQKTLQLQKEWNNQSSLQELPKLQQQNKDQVAQIQASKSEADQARKDAQRANQDLIKAKHDLEAKQQELGITQRLIDSAKAELASTQGQLQASELIVKRTQEALQHQEDSVQLLKQSEELQGLKLKSQQTELDSQKQKNLFYLIAAGLALALLVVLGALLYFRQRAVSALAEKNKIIQEEKRRSDELLLNILPEEVMQELKAHGKTTARNYAKATVLFADIKNFTAISEQLSPDDLIEGLDTYFEAFDKVIEKYDIEKIKTIGDAYVCAGGVPTKNDVNPHAVVQAALDFVREIDKLRKSRTSAGKVPFEFRIGIHTGHLVAGVIGVRKFAYDIWGDTVNMAARMEQSSEPNKINISGATYELVKDKFACVYRGKVEAKNKGEIDMYFVEKAIV